MEIVQTPTSYWQPLWFFSHLITPPNQFRLCGLDPGSSGVLAGHPLILSLVRVLFSFINVPSSLIGWLGLVRFFLTFRCGLLPSSRRRFSSTASPNCKQVEDRCLLLCLLFDFCLAAAQVFSIPQNGTYRVSGHFPRDGG